jgi:hypothetical protein
LASGFGVGPAQANEHEPVALAASKYLCILVLAYSSVSFSCFTTEKDL